MTDTLAQGRTKWSLTPEAFGQLLATLDPDRERAGEKYEQIRRGLVCFFEWRGCPFPEEHADEALNRVARKLGEGDQISDPSTYVYGVARMLLLEIFREQERQRTALASLPQTSQTPPDAQGPDDTQLRYDCFGECLDSLPPESREFILQYYQGERRAKIKNRKEQAAQLRIPPNALRLRARRLREKLEICVDECLKKR